MVGQILNAVNNASTSQRKKVLIITYKERICKVAVQLKLSGTESSISIVFGVKLINILILHVI